VIDGAQSEIEALSGLDKSTGAVTAAKNAKSLSGLPGIIKEFAQKMEDEVKNLKELTEELKDQNKLSGHVKKAKECKSQTGRDAYRDVFGGVWYTAQEKAVWKPRMDKIKLKINEAEYKAWECKEPKSKPQAL